MRMGMRMITRMRLQLSLSLLPVSYYCGKNYFEEDGKLNYYVFQPLFKYLEVARVGNITHILSRKFKGQHDTKIKTIATNNYLLNPRINIYDMGNIRIKFNGSF